MALKISILSEFLAHLITIIVHGLYLEMQHKVNFLPACISLFFIGLPFLFIEHLVELHSVLCTGSVSVSNRSGSKEQKDKRNVLSENWIEQGRAEPHP